MGVFLQMNNNVGQNVTHMIMISKKIGEKTRERTTKNIGFCKEVIYTT